MQLSSASKSSKTSPCTNVPLACPFSLENHSPTQSRTNTNIRYLVPAIGNGREQIVKLFKKHPAYKTWNDESIKLFAQFGVYEDADGKLRLKSKKEHEAVRFSLSLLPVSRVLSCTVI